MAVREATKKTKAKTSNKSVNKAHNKENSRQNNNSFVFSGYLKICAVLFVAILLSCIFFLNKAINISSGKQIKYSEKSNIDYNVYLLPNDFYDKDYLGKDMAYVASLIDKISLNFNYSFQVDTKVDMDFTYSIMGKLSITDKVGSKSYYEKEYVLLENQNLEMKNNTIQTINENLDIDYLYYNNIANKFRNAYGVEADSKLDVYMVINKKSSKIVNYSSDETAMSISIPLSQKTINITMQSNEIDNNNSIAQDKGIFIKNYPLLVSGIVLLIVAIVLAIIIINALLKLKNKESKYDIVLNKVLKQYDRLIAETETKASFDNKNVIKVTSFTELLDVHDNLQLPIIHYIITPHVESYFYIICDDDIYLYILRDIDLEVGKNAKV